MAITITPVLGGIWFRGLREGAKNCGMGYSISRNSASTPPTRPQTVCFDIDEFGECYVPLKVKQPTDPSLDNAFAVYFGETDVRFYVWSPFLFGDEAARPADGDIIVDTCGLIPMDGESMEIPDVASIQTTPGLGEVSAGWTGVQTASQRIPNVSGYYLDYREVLRADVPAAAIAVIDTPATVSGGVLYDDANDIGSIRADYDVAEGSEISYVEVGTSVDDTAEVTIRIDANSWEPVLGTLSDKRPVSAAVILPNGVTRIFPSSSLVALTQREATWRLPVNNTYTIRSSNVLTRFSRYGIPRSWSDFYRTNQVDIPIPWASIFEDVDPDLENEAITQIEFHDREPQTSSFTDSVNSRLMSDMTIRLGGVYVPQTESNRSIDYQLDNAVASFVRGIQAQEIFARTVAQRPSAGAWRRKRAAPELKTGVTGTVRIRVYEEPFQVISRDGVYPTRLQISGQNERTTLRMRGGGASRGPEVYINPDIAGAEFTTNPIADGNDGRGVFVNLYVIKPNPDPGYEVWLTMTGFTARPWLSFLSRGVVTVEAAGNTLTLPVSESYRQPEAQSSTFVLNDFRWAFDSTDTDLISFFSALDALTTTTVPVTITLDARQFDSDDNVIPYSDWWEFPLFEEPETQTVVSGESPSGSDRIRQEIPGYGSTQYRNVPPPPVPEGFAEFGEAMFLFTGTKPYREVQIQLEIEGLGPDTRWTNAPLADGRAVVMLFPDGTTLDHPWERVPTRSVQETITGLAQGTIWQFRVAPVSASFQTGQFPSEHFWYPSVAPLRAAFTPPRVELPVPTAIVPVGRIENPIDQLSEEQTYIFRAAGVYPAGATVTWEVVSGSGSFNGSTYNPANIAASERPVIGLRVDGVLVDTDQFYVYAIRSVGGRITNKIDSLQEGETHQFLYANVVPSGSLIEWQIRSGGGSINNSRGHADFGTYTAPTELSENVLVTIELAVRGEVVDINQVRVLAARGDPEGRIANKITSILEGETHDFNYADVNADDDEISWAVFGRPVVGTISDTGLYTAPMVPEDRITANAIVRLDARDQFLDDNQFTVVRNIPVESETQYAYIRGDTQPALPNPEDQRNVAHAPSGWSETELETSRADNVYRISRTVETLLDRFARATDDWAFDPAVQPWRMAATAGMISRTQGVADNKMVAHSVGAATMNFSAGEEDKAFTRRNLATAIGRSTPSDPDDAVTVQVFETAVNDALGAYSISNETVNGSTVTWDAPPGTWPWTYQIATRATAGGTWTDQGSQTARSYTAAAGTVQVRIIPRSASDALTTIVDL